ncbi:sugar-binding transcriptional regulator [Mesobacterium pallidum]|uniref:sugar-binding transcriptional regulator n=1 Tax=Mesobacterium pallidum TaxID=2872037 RepID=UPI001EE1CD23|nr:sugar-binding transcriptional regulator [Mesobacterium pallidum]
MNRVAADDTGAGRRDLAARAAWLYYVAGMTQDQVARELGISRQRAQRLVALAVSENLIRVRIDHPIAECLELERDLRGHYALDWVRVAPALAAGDEALTALAPFAAPSIESVFADGAPRLVALGTGRTLRAVIEQMQTMDGKHHKVVSLIGNVSPDGSASFYEVIMRVADKTGAAHYPMSAPVMARSLEELATFRDLPHVKSTMALARSADLTIVGIGQMDDSAPLLKDGFITAEQLASLRAAGAVGEICSHIFDAEGRYLDHPVNDLMVGQRLMSGSARRLCIGGGREKQAALRAALKGRLITDLITDENTARALLAG